MHAQINKIGAKMDLERAQMEHASTQMDKVGAQMGQERVEMDMLGLK